PLPLDLPRDTLTFLHTSLGLAIAKLDKYLALIKDTLAYWLAVILTPSFLHKWIRVKVPEKVDKALSTFT
ncbi:hypothetical protein QBC39DRAFT_264832, partial [Podospora conica]